MNISSSQILLMDLRRNTKSFIGQPLHKQNDFMKMARVWVKKSKGFPQRF